MGRTGVQAAELGFERRGGWEIGTQVQPSGGLLSTQEEALLSSASLAFSQGGPSPPTLWVLGREGRCRVGEQTEGSLSFPPSQPLSKHFASRLRGWLGADDLYKVPTWAPGAFPEPLCSVRASELCPAPSFPCLRVVSLCGQGPGWGHLCVTLTFED